jgi:hypothetical protein
MSAPKAGDTQVHLYSLSFFNGKLILISVEA